MAKGSKKPQRNLLDEKYLMASRARLAIEETIEFKRSEPNYHEFQVIWDFFITFGSNPSWNMYVHDLAKLPLAA